MGKASIQTSRSAIFDREDLLIENASTFFLIILKIASKRVRLQPASLLSMRVNDVASDTGVLMTHYAQLAKERGGGKIA